MYLQRLHEISKEKGYTFRFDEKTGVTVFTGKTDIVFRIKQLPKNIVFKNKGDVKLELIRRVPRTTVFDNAGSVIIGDETTISETFKGFKQLGNLIPENLKFNKPKVKYFFSEELSFFVQENIKNKWVAKLADLNNSFVEEEDDFQASFIDCAEDMSFLPLKEIFKKYIANKATETHKSIDHYLSVHKNNLLKDGLKNSIKAGRFIRRIFPEMRHAEVEEFVTLFRGFKKSKDCGLEVVRGKDIVKFYNRKNQTVGSSGRLRNSCMNYDTESDSKFKNLQFYASIPNCGLLIMRDPKNSEKIVGRALIWSTNDGRTYVDSIYTAKDSDLYVYKRFIQMNGCLSYVNNDSLTGLVIDCPEKTSKLDHYMPYLDTMRYDKAKNQVIANRRANGFGD